jgi:hypothetical protein
LVKYECFQREEKILKIQKKKKAIAGTSCGSDFFVLPHWRNILFVILHFAEIEYIYVKEKVQPLKSTKIHYYRRRTFKIKIYFS